MPYVTYRRVSSSRESGMGADIGIVSARFQLDAFGDDRAGGFSAVRGVIDQLRQATQRWASPSGSPEVIDTFIESDLDTFETDPVVHHSVLDIIIHYRE